MKDLKAIRAASLLRKLVDEGEHDTQDFKFTVNDPIKIARSVSAFANNKGGHLLIGVDDNGRIKGVRSEEDIYVVEAAASIYCQPECKLEFSAYKDNGGAIVIRADIAPSRHRPVFVKEEGNRLKAYFRVGDENIVAHPLMVRVWKKQDAESSAMMFDIEASHSSILNVLAENPISVENMYRQVNMSKSRIDASIVTLAQMGLIEFVFRNRTFLLKLKEED